MPIKRFRLAAIATTAIVPCGVMLAAYGGPAFAADGASSRPAAVSNSSTLAEVVVTAERRNTDIQRTPLAITAVSSAALTKNNAENITVLSDFVPSLTIAKTGGRETVPTIRGIGSATPENSGTTGPGVSLFLDGAYVGDSVSAGQGLFDIDHVEVLRGPQGTLYGVSSTGGAIIIVSRAPRLHTFDTSGDFSFGNYDYFRERAEVNLPLGDQFALRVSGQRLDHHGFSKNLVTGQDLDDAHTGDIKASLLWQPRDDFSATFTGQWFSQRNHGQAQKSIFDTTPDPRELQQDFLSKNNYDSAFYHLNLNYDSSWVTIKSVTAYRRFHSNVAENVTFTTIEQYSPYEEVPRFYLGDSAWTEELDFLSPSRSKLKWDAGIFLMRRRSNSEVLEYQGNSLSDPMPVGVDESLPGSALPQDLVFGNNDVDIRTVVEPFLQFTYPIRDDLRLTAGVRYNYERHRLSAHNFSKFGNVPTATFTDATKIPTWRAQLDWDVTPDNLLYASVATGYKAGGINGSTSDLVVPRIFKPEHNTAFEIGSKNTFFDRQLRANFAAFYYNYRDMQYIETDPIPFGQGMSNIPAIHIWGLEGEISYNGFENHLHLNAVMSYERGKIVGKTLTLYPTIVNAVYNSPACAYFGQYYNPACWAAVIAASHDISGNTPPNMPRFSGTFTASYDFNIAGGVFTPEVSFIHHGSQWARIFNEPALDRVKAYDLLNLSATYAMANGHVRISLNATNLANRAAVNNRYTSPYESGLTSVEYVPPRQIIGTIAYQF